MPAGDAEAVADTTAAAEAMADTAGTTPSDEVKLWCGVYKMGIVFSIDVSLGKTVEDLQKKVVDIRGARNVAFQVDPPMLKLYVARNETTGKWLAMDGGTKTYLRDGDPSGYLEMLEGALLSAYFTATPAAGSIHVLVDLPQSQTLTTAAPNIPTWVERSDCPPLEFKEESLIRIPGWYVEGSGLYNQHGTTADMLLYRRPDLVREWQQLLEYTIKSYAQMSIMGPPGTGKSCAAFAFACSLDRGSQGAEWDVLWIHDLSQVQDEAVSCILFRGNTKKTCTASFTDVPSLLTTLTKQAVVFFDGYAQDRNKVVRNACLRWRRQDVMCHRVVCVCSMVSLGKPWHPELLQNLKETVRATPLNTKAAFATADEPTDTPRYEAVLFRMMSWTIEEYQQALSNAAFFNHVRRKFTTSTGDVSDAERLELLERKFYVVGGSARLMFDRTMEEAAKILKDVFTSVQNPQDYVNCDVGITAKGAVNRLFAWYATATATGNDPSEPKVRLLSTFVARKFACRLGLDYVQRIASALASNPSMDGHFFELWFFSKLCHGGLQSFAIANGEQVPDEFWVSESDVVDVFDPSGVIPINSDTQWLAPIKWNQGGCDAVFLEIKKKTVNFFQVTRAKDHSFKEDFFTTLLTRLGMLKLISIEKVVVYFVVPLASLKEFTEPVDSLALYKDVVQPSLGGKDRRTEGFVKVASVVKVVAVEYYGLEDSQRKRQKVV